MQIIDDCPKCGKDFMHSPSLEYHLYTFDPNDYEDINKNYPLQDSTWASRRWNKEHTEFVDLSGNVAICQECYEKENPVPDTSNS